MSLLNVEIKAGHKDVAFVRNYLQHHNADFRGIDRQVDTYFNVANGRLKLREGNIENNLIFYQRTNQAGPKSSHFELVAVQEPKQLKAILSSSLGIKVVVEKKREIYFIENVKFHIDEVPGLGQFVEIEASNKGYKHLAKEQLMEQCAFYMNALNIDKELLIEKSYSDLLLEKV